MCLLKARQWALVLFLHSEVPCTQWIEKTSMELKTFFHQKLVSQTIQKAHVWEKSLIFLLHLLQGMCVEPLKIALQQGRFSHMMKKAISLVEGSQFLHLPQKISLDIVKTTPSLGTRSQRSPAAPLLVPGMPFLLLLEETRVGLLKLSFHQRLCPQILWGSIPAEGGLLSSLLHQEP
jgi:hypothetical protein